MTRVRYVYQLHGGSLEADLDTLDCWINTTKREVSNWNSVCVIFYGMENPVLRDRIGDSCIHELHLPDSDDRYSSQLMGPLIGDSPWGQKSGPNRQFFSAAETLGKAHPDDWCLLLEPDTLPLHSRVHSSIINLISAHTAAWMIGAFPSRVTTESASPRLSRHLNGAALYRFGDKYFQDFISAVWIPSLLQSLRYDPLDAFDAITRLLWVSSEFPHLHPLWRAQEARFIRTPEIINASTVNGKFLEAWQFEQLKKEIVNAWLLHMKSPRVVLDHLSRQI